MTIRVVDHLTERDMRAEESNEGSDCQKDHAFSRGTSLHHRQQCADALVLEEGQSGHRHKLFAVEGLPAWSGLIVVLSDMQRTENNDGDDHQVDNNDRVNIAVLEHLERPDPGDRSKHYQCDSCIDPKVDLDLFSARRLIGLRYDLLASASKEAEHCKTVAEVKKCYKDLEDVLVSLAKRVLDQISVGEYLRNLRGLDQSNGRKRLHEAGSCKDDGRENIPTILEADRQRKQTHGRVPIHDGKIGHAGTHARPFVVVVTNYSCGDF